MMIYLLWKNEYNSHPVFLGAYSSLDLAMLAEDNYNLNNPSQEDRSSTFVTQATLDANHMETV